MLSRGNASKFQESRQKRLSDVLLPWQRSFQFWARATDIYVGYKVCQIRVKFVKDTIKQDQMWDRQHELAAEKLYSMCSELGGFFLKVAQIIGKPDLAPAAWVRRLVTLCDKAPATPFEVVQSVLEKELSESFEKLFERFDQTPIGSASIAQVHRARMRGAKRDVAVKVQHPGVQQLMMMDIRNLRMFATFLQNTDVKFDLLSVTTEIEKQVGYEFDFLREAEAMETIQKFLSANNKRSPVIVPHVIRHMTTRGVLLMDFIDGTPIMNLGEEMAKRGIDPGGKVAAVAKQNILRSLSLAYGQMILKSGFFHADPHPGNIFICRNAEVALLDYGQVKHISDNLRLAFANLMLAIVEDSPLKASESFRELGICTTPCADGPQEILKLAKTMFDTRIPPGVKTLTPFQDDSSLKKLSVQAFPEELFFVLRTVNLLRGLSVGLGVNFSCPELWKPLAEEALYSASVGRPLHDKPKRSFLRRLFWRK